MNNIQQLEYIYHEIFSSLYFYEINMTNIKEVWKFLGIQNKLSNEDMKNIMNLSCNMKNLTNSSYKILLEAKQDLIFPKRVKENKKENEKDDKDSEVKNEEIKDSQVKDGEGKDEKEKIYQFYLHILKTNFEKISNFRKEMIDKLYQITEQLNLKSKIEHYQTKNKKTKNWVYELVLIYLKYGGKIPNDTHSFLLLFKQKWDEIISEDQNFIIYCCEDILGGYKLEWISNNLKTWILNYSDDSILKNDLVPLKIENGIIQNSPSLKSAIPPNRNINSKDDDDLELLQI